EQVAGLLVAGVALGLLFPGRLLDLLLLLLVALGGRLEVRRGLLPGGEPGCPRGLLHGPLDALRLVVGPLVGGLRLEAGWPPPPPQRPGSPVAPPEPPEPRPSR